MFRKEVGALFTAGLAISGIILGFTSPAEVRASSENSSGVDSYAVALLADIQKFRAENNRPLFMEDSVIESVEQTELNEMVAGNYISHVSPTGETFPSRLTKLNVPYLQAGEDLAYNNCPDEETEKVAFDWLLQSPPHRAILLGDYDSIGVFHLKNGDMNIYGVGEVKHPPGYLSHGGRHR